MKLSLILFLMSFYIAGYAQRLPLYVEYLPHSNGVKQCIVSEQYLGMPAYGKPTVSRIHYFDRDGKDTCVKYTFDKKRPSRTVFTYEKGLVKNIKSYGSFEAYGPSYEKQKWLKDMLRTEQSYIYEDTFLVSMVRQYYPDINDTIIYKFAYYPSGQLKSVVCVTLPIAGSLTYNDKMELVTRYIDSSVVLYTYLDTTVNITSYNHDTISKIEKIRNNKYGAVLNTLVTDVRGNLRESTNYEYTYSASDNKVIEIRYSRTPKEMLTDGGPPPPKQKLEYDKAGRIIKITDIDGSKIIKVETRTYVMY